MTASMSTPFDRPTSSIPVTVVTSDAVAPQPEDVAVLRLEPALHDHRQDEDCIACATRADIRAMLFNLLQEVRTGARPPFRQVIVDAHRLADPRPIVDRLDPHARATGLRDHTVARSFHLTRVI